jgi:hypothetical protein
VSSEFIKEENDLFFIAAVDEYLKSLPGVTYHINELTRSIEIDTKGNEELELQVALKISALAEIWGGEESKLH